MELRHPLAGGLVFGETLVPEGRPGQVEGDRDVRRLDVLEPTKDDAAEPEDRVDQLALRGGKGREREVLPFLRRRNGSTCYNHPP